MTETALDRVKQTLAAIDQDIRELHSKVTAENRDLHASEARNFERLQKERVLLQVRAEQLEAQEASRAADAAVQARFGARLDDAGLPIAGGFGNGADTVYGRGSGNSYFRDLVLTAMPGDPRGFEAHARLAEHAQLIERAASDLPREFRATRTRGSATQEMRVNPNRTDGQGGYSVPPLWMLDEWVAALRAGRAIADRCHKMDLPAGTDSVNLPKTNTGTSTAIQGADGGAVASTDLTDAAVSGPVRTIAGQQDMSLQLLDQSPINFDEIVFRDLIADYNKQLDLQVINGSGAAGQMKGLLNVAGTNAITYTDASPTVPKIYAPVGQAASQVARLRFAAADTVAMCPQHWWWIASALDTQNRPLVEPTGKPGMNTISVLDPNAAEGVAGSISGIPVVVDANMPQNLGAGTNQAPFLVGRFSDFYLYEGAMRTRALMEVLSGTLQVRLQVYNYAAFIGDRYPTALSVVNGTGLIVPAGF